MNSETKQAMISALAEFDDTYATPDVIVRAIIEALEKTPEMKALRELQSLVLADWPYCVGNDTDGEHYAGMLQKAGLAHRAEVVEPCNGPWCPCDPGDMCWRLTEAGIAARDGK